MLGIKTVVEDVVGLFKMFTSIFNPYQKTSFLPVIAFLSHLIFIALGSAMVAEATLNLHGFELDKDKCPPWDAFEVFALGLGISTLVYGVAGFFVRPGYVSMRLLFYAGVELCLCYLIFGFAGGFIRHFNIVAPPPDSTLHDHTMDATKRGRMKDVWRMGITLNIVFIVMTAMNWLHSEPLGERAFMMRGDLEHTQHQPRASQTVEGRGGEPPVYSARPPSNVFTVGSDDEQSDHWNEPENNGRPSGDGRPALELPRDTARHSPVQHSARIPSPIEEFGGGDGLYGDTVMARNKSVWCRMPGTFPCGNCHGRTACGLYVRAGKGWDGPFFTSRCEEHSL